MVIAERISISEWGIYFSLYTYVRTYVVRTYRNMSYFFNFPVPIFGHLLLAICKLSLIIFTKKNKKKEYVTLRNVDRNVVGFLPAS